MASSTCHVVGVAKRVRLERIVSPLLAETTPDSSSDPSVPSSVGGGPRTLQGLSSSSALAVRRPLLEIEVDKPRSDERGGGNECVSPLRTRGEGVRWKIKINNN